MNLLLLTGGFEWILIVFFSIIFLIVLPILAIIFYTKNKQINKQIADLTEEKNGLSKGSLKNIIKDNP